MRFTLTLASECKLALNRVMRSTSGHTEELLEICCGRRVQAICYD